MENSTLINNVTSDELLTAFRQIVREEIATLQPDKDTPKYLSRAEAASMLHITLPTLWEYTKIGLIEGSRIGRRVLYSEEAIKKAVQEIPSLRYKRR